MAGDTVAGNKVVNQVAGGDIVGRDKITTNIQNIVQRALSAAEEAAQARSLETQILAQGVQALAERLAARPSEEAGRRKPYKGLAEYRLDEAELFSGRGQALRELVQTTANAPLTILHGDAGVGKTSLLLAGLMPSLLAGEELPLVLRPYTVEPALAIRRAFIADLSQAPLLAAAPLRDFLLKVSVMLGATTLTICLDQFEEFFALLDDAARRAFVGALAECLDDASLRVRWVLALRSEAFGSLASFRPGIRNPFENDYRLCPLTRAEALEVITRAGPPRGPAYEPALLERLLDDLGPDEVAPAQLQLACSRLYDGLPPGGALVTRALYESEGGVAGILRRYLDDVLAGALPPADRDPAWRVLAAVAEAGPRAPGEAALSAHLQAFAVNEAQARRVLGFLESSQLLRLNGERYELASDSLLPRIREWAAERSALEQARAEARRQRLHIGGSALRGMLAGLAGFGLAYAAAYATQGKSTLLYLTLERTIPGALAGLLFVFLADLAFAVYRSPRQPARWLAGGLAGAVSFGPAVAYHALLRSALLAWPQVALAVGQGLLEGAAWGLMTGLGLVWVLASPWPRWQSVPAVTAAAALAFVAIESALHLFERAPLWGLFAAGAVMPVCLLAADLLAPQHEDL